VEIYSEIFSALIMYLFKWNTSKQAACVSRLLGVDDR